MRRSPHSTRPSVLRCPAVALLISCPLFVFPARGDVSPIIEPPSPVTSIQVPYPTGAQGDASVELELVVGKDGAVSSVRVVSGHSPFTEACEMAARGWRFVPAKRGGVEVAARIRIAVGFQPSVPSPSLPAGARGPSVEDTETSTPEEPDSAPANAPDATAAPVPVQEIMVTGPHRDAQGTRLTVQETRNLAGTLGDPMRAISALPGITPIQSANPLFFVRGAAPGNNAFLIDGVSVPLVFHAGLGPSVVHPGLVDHVDFFPSGAPAAYGRFAGGVMAVETQAPADRPRAELGLRLIDASALVESPIADGKGSVLAAGRYGYPDLVLGLVARSTQLSYWDYQARTTWNAGPNDQVGVFLFGSHDRTAHVDRFNGNDYVTEQLASDFHVGDLRYDHFLPGGRLRLAATVGTTTVGAAPFYAKDRFVAARTELESHLSSHFLLRGGADTRLDLYGIERNAADPLNAIVPSSADPPTRNVEWGARADVVWNVTPGVSLTPGLRFDLYDSARTSSGGAAAAVDPRIASRVELASGVAWLASAGLTHQLPQLRVGTAPGSVASVPGFPVGRAMLQTAVQTSQGFELRLPADVTVTTSSFLNWFSGLTDLTRECRANSMWAPGERPSPPTSFDCADEPMKGLAYGVEILVRRPLTRKLAGWLSYTLSRSTRDAHFTGADINVVARVASEYDRTHVLSAVGTYDLGRDWRIGTRVVFYTGQPYSLTSNGVPIAPYNDQRYPSFFRLDTRLEKRWPLGPSGSLSFVFETQNVTRSREFSSRQCRPTGILGAVDTCTYEATATIIPSVGFEATL